LLLRQTSYCAADDVGWIVYHLLPSAKKRNISDVRGGIRSEIRNNSEYSNKNSNQSLEYAGINCIEKK